MEREDQVGRTDQTSDYKIVKLTVAFPRTLDKSGTPNSKTEAHVMKVLAQANKKLLSGWLTTRTKLEHQEYTRWY